MTISDNIFDVRDFGAYLDGVHDDTTAFQNAVDAAQLVNGTSYGPVAEVFCPIGHTILTSSVIRVGPKPLRLNIRSIQFYDNPTGAAWIFNEYAPGMATGHWDIDMEGILAKNGAPGFPSSINPNGNSAVTIRAMTNSHVRIRQVGGFSHAGVFLDGRGLTYAGQVINKNRFYFGQVYNNGFGVLALSHSASTSCVQGNQFEGDDWFQNHINYSDGDPNFRATTSNTIDLATMDNETAVGLDLWSSYNNIYVGFTGTPGTSVLYRPGTRKNKVTFGNDYATDVVVNDQSGGQNTTVLMP